jgi:hypothetical protein
MVERDPDDDHLAEFHREKDWPPYMHHRAEDGSIRKLDYMVVGTDGDSVEVGVKTSELAKQRALKAAGLPSDSDTEGAVTTRSIHPLDLVR